MTDLQAQATAFAAMMMKEFSGDTFSREDMYHAYRNAYEQGWVECATEGERPETQDEYFNDVPDYENPGAGCVFYYEGHCSKGLFPPCVREGCGGYIPKSWSRPKDE